MESVGFWLDGDSGRISQSAMLFLTFWVFLTRPVLLYFRVEPAVADWLPHSPVRAQLRHTVLQARISLHRWSGQPLGAVAGKTARAALRSVASSCLRFVGFG